MQFSSKDFTSERFMESPDELFAKMRNAGPVVSARLPVLGNVWMATSSRAVTAMLKDDSRFTTRKRNGAVSGLQWWMPASIRLLADNMLTTDEPDHRRLRGAVDQAFSRRPVMDLENRIRNLAEDLLDSALRAGPQFDLVSLYASQIPLSVICELIGLRRETRHSFFKKAMALNNVQGLFSLVFGFAGVGAMRRILIDELTAVRAGSGDPGLLSDLVHAQEEGADISDHEIIAMMFLLLVAGHMTTTHMIGASALVLLQNAEALKWLREGNDRFGMAVEELLRFVSPVQFSKPRTVQTGGEFFGVELQAGDQIMAGLASANMDPEKFDEPRKLDLERHPNPHLEFGTGIHFCLGHQLARLETKVALEVLLERMPNLTLGEQGYRWNRRLGLRGLERLSVSND